MIGPAREEQGQKEEKVDEKPGGGAGGAGDAN
jgi:hypothetical protein